MARADFTRLLIIVVLSSGLLVVGMYLLAKFNRLFRTLVRNELLRRNLAVWVIAICLVMAVAPITPDFYNPFFNHKLIRFYVFRIIGCTVEVLFIFNISWAVVKYLHQKKISFGKRMTIIMATIIVCTMLMSIPLNYFANKIFGEGASFKSIEVTLLFNFYTGCMTGLVYITMVYIDLDRKRKLSEKELEVSKLQALKTKAELDALHSKINPHFLYNALNSIADLSVTDGKKARRMTVALADLFRYSINYSDHNYSTVKEEVEMTEVYLEIEKIRFEDQLNYSISVAGDLDHYLVPRFILQPVVENAVKHGLKTTGKMTEINIEVKNACMPDSQETMGLQMTVADNGPAFPDDLVPGYGVKSMYDKLDLLFPGNYEVHFSNEPRKNLSIHIHKLMRNESVIQNHPGR